MNLNWKELECRAVERKWGVVYFVCLFGASVFSWWIPTTELGYFLNLFQRIPPSSSPGWFYLPQLNGPSQALGFFDLRALLRFLFLQDSNAATGNNSSSSSRPTIENRGKKPRTAVIKKRRKDFFGGREIFLVKKWRQCMFKNSNDAFNQND